MWGKLIQDIIDSGLSEAQIASEVGVEQPTINRLKNGEHKSTSYETGAALTRLHKKIKRKRKRGSAA